MKWTKKPEPKHKEKRVSKEFALIPYYCDDGFVVWLGWVYIVEEYDANRFHGWIPIKYLSQKPE